MLPDSVAVFYSAPSRNRSNDVEYPFRQSSDFYYLTGFTEENAVLVLTEKKSILYLQERDPEKETWNGLRLGVERAVEDLHVDEAYPISTFQASLADHLKGKTHLYHSFGDNEERDWKTTKTASFLLQRSRAGESGPTRIVHPGEILHEMRLIKDDYELDLLRQSAALAARGHRRAMEQVEPGMMEYELEAVIAYEFRKAGATEGYPSIVASGKNACILHYTQNNKRIREGDLILIDAGAELHYMNSDISRTFPASGQFTEAQAELYSIVLNAQNAALALCQTESTMDRIHEAALDIIVNGLMDLRLLDQSKEQIMEEKLYRKFFMHRTGHWLGVDVHDVGAYSRDGQPRPLEPGMVFTVEPGLYVPDDDDIPEEYRGTGIRIEDDVIITKEGPEIPTRDIPVELSSIEKIISTGE